MLSDKKLTKMEKILGKDKMSSLENGQIDELQVTISKAAGAIKEAKDQLEANPKYQELKESLKAISAAMREVKQFQGAVIEYSLSLIEDKRVPVTDESEYETILRKVK
jgi:hypothetical protein